MNSLPNEIVLDAAKMLAVARKILIQLSRTEACTPEYEAKLLSEARANIHAALARIEE